MLSIVIPSVMFLFVCTFRKSLFDVQRLGFEITLHSSSAPVQIHLIGIPDSPDHRSVRNKEVKFIWIYSLMSRFSTRCPYKRESVLQRVFNIRKFCRDCPSYRCVRIREVSLPRGSTVYFFNLSLLTMSRLFMIFVLSFPLLSGTDTVCLPVWSCEKGDRESHRQALWSRKITVTEYLVFKTIATFYRQI